MLSVLQKITEQVFIPFLLIGGFSIFFRPPKPLRDSYNLYVATPFLFFLSWRLLLEIRAGRYALALTIPLIFATAIFAHTLTTHTNISTQKFIKLNIKTKYLLYALITLLPVICVLKNIRMHPYNGASIRLAQKIKNTAFQGPIWVSKKEFSRVQMILPNHELRVIPEETYYKRTDSYVQLKKFIQSRLYAPTPEMFILEEYGDATVISNAEYGIVPSFRIEHLFSTFTNSKKKKKISVYKLIPGNPWQKTLTHRSQDMLLGDGDFSKSQETPKYCRPQDFPPRNWNIFNAEQPKGNSLYPVFSVIKDSKEIPFLLLDSGCSYTLGSSYYLPNGNYLLEMILSGENGSIIKIGTQNFLENHQYQGTQYLTEFSIPTTGLHHAKIIFDSSWSNNSAPLFSLQLTFPKGRFCIYKILLHPI